jgi:hypothetical protein
VGHPALDPTHFVHGDRSVSLAARRLTEHLREFYISELNVRELARREPA